MSPSAAKKKRSWTRRIASLLLFLLSLAFVAPYVCQYNPARDWLLGLVFRNVQGSVTTDGASLGWFSAPAIYGFCITDRQSQAVVTVPAILGDRPLWQILLRPTSPGNFSVHEPQIDVLLYEDDTNLKRVFGRPPASGGARQVDQKPASLERVSKIAAGLEIHGASFSIQRADSTHRWEAGAVNFAAQLVPESTDGTVAHAEIAAGQLLDRTRLTPGLCDDVLKFIAPILAGATVAEGEVSIELDAWRIPLGRPAESVGGGRLTLHSVKVGAGPVVQQLAAQFGLEDSVQLADQAVVTFAVRDGRVFHDGLKFGLPGYRIRSSGSVGLLDESLDLVVEVPVPLPHELPEDRKLLRALSGQTLRIPISGTLDQPEVKIKALSQSILGMLGGALSGLGRSPADQEDPHGDAQPSGDPLDNVLDFSGDWLEQLPIGDRQLLERLNQREPRLRQSPNRPSPNRPSDEDVQTSDDDPGTRPQPLLDRLRQRRQQRRDP